MKSSSMQLDTEFSFVSIATQIISVMFDTLIHQRSAELYSIISNTIFTIIHDSSRSQRIAAEFLELKHVYSCKANLFMLQLNSITSRKQE